MIRGPRISLRAPTPPFVPSTDRLARVTFAELDGEEPRSQLEQDRRLPALWGVTDEGAVATVIVWPTDDRGFVDVPAVQRGEVQVTFWRLTAAEVACLREIDALGWSFALHDVLVAAGPPPRLVPCRETFRLSPFAPRLTPADLHRLAALAAA